MRKFTRIKNNFSRQHLHVISLSIFILYIDAISALTYIK